jgi:phenylpropionate dioxygenase-like ring-hydroxylating dioxygenase large terminal subunit
VAARTDEVADKPFGRTICGEPIVLFRRRDGSIAALEDRCPHRKYALSKGAVIGDEIQCGYHGLQFDGSGACTKIPSQRTIPRGFGTRAYSVVDRYGYIFVWMGEPAAADAALLPEAWASITAPGWTAVHGFHHVRANYQLLIDNLLDLTHLAVIHKTTIASPGMPEPPLKVDIDGDRVRTFRALNNVSASPLHKAVSGLTGMVDRSWETEFVLPACVNLVIRARPAGTQDPRPHHLVLNALTPETESTTHYFWALPRCIRINDANASKALWDMNQTAFDEDAAVIEIQQRMIDSDGTPLLAALDGDKAAAAARRIIAGKLAEQIRTSAVA